MNVEPVWNHVHGYDYLVISFNSSAEKFRLASHPMGMMWRQTFSGGLGGVTACKYCNTNLYHSMWATMDEVQRWM